jgi:mevalonate pyrophosphate decarboxylase
MNVGMLWFDNDPKTDITMKINRAVDYYRHKYGQTPNLCFVHPSMVKTSPLKTGTTLGVVWRWFNYTPLLS